MEYSAISCVKKLFFFFFFDSRLLNPFLLYLGHVILGLPLFSKDLIKNHALKISYHSASGANRFASVRIRGSDLIAVVVYLRGSLLVDCMCIGQLLST